MLSELALAVVDWSRAFILLLRAFLYNALFGDQARILAGGESSRSDQTDEVYFYGKVTEVAEVNDAAAVVTLELTALLDESRSPQFDFTLSQLLQQPTKQAQRKTFDLFDESQKKVTLASLKHLILFISENGSTQSTLACLELVHSLMEMNDVVELFFSDQSGQVTVSAVYSIVQCAFRTPLAPIAKDIVNRMLDVSNWDIETDSSSSDLCIVFLYAIAIARGRGPLVDVFEKVPNCMDILRQGLSSEELLTRGLVAYISNVIAGTASLAQRLGEIEGVLDGLLAIAFDNRIQLEKREWALCTLFRLGAIPSNADRMFQHERLLPALIALCETQGHALTAPTLVHWAIIILLILANRSDDIKQTMFRDARLMNTLAKIVRPDEHCGSTHLRELSTGLLMVLSSCEGNRAQPQVLDYLNIFVQVIEKHESQQTIDHAILAIAALSLEVSNRQKMRASQALIRCLTDVLAPVKLATDTGSNKVLERGVIIIGRLNLTMDNLNSIRAVTTMASVFSMAKPLQSTCPLRTLDPNLLRVLANTLY